jgi:hypothetical protein
MCLCVGFIVATAPFVCRAFNLYQSFPENGYALGAFIALLIFTAFMAALFSVLSFKIYKASRDKETSDDEKLREFVMAAFTYAMNGGDDRLKRNIRTAVNDAINELTEGKAKTQCGDGGTNPTGMK